MMSSIVILLTITFLAMMSPGPDMLLILRHGASKGRSGLACVVGIVGGVSCHVLLALLGLSVVVKQSVFLYLAVRYLGAAYLIYVGVRTFCSASSHLSSTERSEIVPKYSTMWSAFREGLFCNLLNPKVTIFILSVFTQIVSPAAPYPERLLLAFVMIGEVFFVWSLFLFVIKLKPVQTFLARCEGAINRISGGVLVGFGGLVLVDP